MEKRYKILVLGTIGSMLLGVFFALGYNHLSSNKVFAEAEKGNQTLSIEDAINRASFNVKQPKNIPFEVTHSFASVSNINNKEMIQLYYVNNQTGDVLTVRAINSKVVPLDSENLLQSYSSSELNDTKYLNNGNAQIFYWSDGGVSYTLIGEKGNVGAFGKSLASEHNIFSPNELESIAKSTK